MTTAHNLGGKQPIYLHKTVVVSINLAALTKQDDIDKLRFRFILSAFENNQERKNIFVSFTQNGN